MASFQITGLTAWNFAVYFALHNKGKFPRNEYEILEYFVEQTLRWEKGKSREGEPLPVEILSGLLVRLGRSADGERNGRKSWRITPDAILEVVGRYYPFLLERKVQLFSALRQIAFLEYEAETGAFHLDYRLGCYFAAKNIVMMALQADADHLREECQHTLSFQTFSFLLQAFTGFDDESRASFYETGRRMFEDSARLYRSEGGQKHVSACTDHGAARQSALAEGGRVPPRSVRPSQGLSGNGQLGLRSRRRLLRRSAAVDAYIRRLKKDRNARQVNRTITRVARGSGSSPSIRCTPIEAGQS